MCRSCSSPPEPKPGRNDAKIHSMEYATGACCGQKLVGLHVLAIASAQHLLLVGTLSDRCELCFLRESSDCLVGHLRFQRPSPMVPES